VKATYNDGKIRKKIESPDAPIVGPFPFVIEVLGMEVVQIELAKIIPRLRFYSSNLFS
jgi:hypothetical protein